MQLENCLIFKIKAGGDGCDYVVFMSSAIVLHESHGGKELTSRLLQVLVFLSFERTESNRTNRRITA